MESVMNFLADNYVWFFVAAGILCFALIGFIIESRKKQKNEFKGDSIEQGTNQTKENASDIVSNTTAQTVNNMTTENVMNTVTPVSATMPEVSVQENVSQAPVDNINNIVNTEANSISSVDTPIVQSTEMEINDIPLVNNGAQSTETPIEFYSGPIEMPVETPKPMPVENLRDPFEMNNNINTNTVQVEQSAQATIGEPISYTQVQDMNQNNNIQPTNIEKDQSSTNNTDVFNG